MTRSARAGVHGRVVAVEPERTWARPGDWVGVRVRLAGDGPGAGALRLALVDVDDEAAAVSRRVRLAAGVREVRVRIRLPGTHPRGYAVRATLAVDGAAGRPAAAEAVVEALAGWWEAPRHVALTDFRPGLDADAAIAGVRRWHATVAQAYDWMYRHYRYRAPEEPFRDALGRLVSHGAVRALVRAGHRSGVATLAYGSVYGAEPEYVARHPGERVFDDAGEPHSLGGAFYINDLRPGRPWRRRLLREYAAACRAFGFDGIHMDTYGPPHEAVASDGTRIRFAELYPGLIADGAATVAATGAGRRVLFNCVEGFPVDAVGAAPTAAHYLELWPPDDRYADLVRWVERARATDPAKAVIIAAYVPALREAGTDPVARRAAVEAATLLACVIAGAGAFHHGIAEGDRVLVEGYYPTAVPLRRPEVRELRAAWRFTARYVHLLADPLAGLIDGGLPSLTDAEGVTVPVSLVPKAGAVWVRGTSTPRGRVLSLVDLRAQDDDRWTAPHPPSPTRRGWRLDWPGGRAPLAMSPWTRDGAPVRLARDRAASAWVLQPFRRWALVVDLSGVAGASS